MYSVVVIRPGKAKYKGGDYIDMVGFRDYKKARDYYTDMLVKYPDYIVRFGKEI